jgi:hypothetical protein
MGIAALLGSLTACGSNDQGKTPLSYDASTVEGFVKGLVAVYCDRILHCPGWVDEIDFPSQDVCLERLSTSIVVAYDQSGVIPAVAAGTVVYDSKAASQCLGALQSTCVTFQAFLPRRYGLISPWLDQLPGCAGVFTGTKQEGQPCVYPFDCVGDAYCKPDGTFFHASCNGVCSQWSATLGQPCGRESDYRCSHTGAQGLSVCLSNNSPMGKTCVDLRLGPDATAGEACGLMGGGNVWTLVACQEGLTCSVTALAYVPPAQGTCVAPIPPGGACSLFGSNPLPCAIHTACDGKQCASPPWVEQVGGACQTRSLLCSPYLHLSCNYMTGTCESLGDGQEGSSCDFDRDFVGLYGAAHCAPGLICVNSKCSRPGEAGDACTNYLQCRSDRCDPNGATGVCAATACGDPLCGTSGEPCCKASFCDSGMNCVSGVCM